MQAVFSVVAIVAATLIAWWQRHSDRSDRLRSEHAIALVAGAAVETMLPAVVGVVTAIQNGIPSITHENVRGRVQRYLHLSEAVHVPNEQQLLQLHPMLPKTAGALAVACTIYRNMVMSLALINARQDAPPMQMTTQVKTLLSTCEDVRLRFLEAEANLHAFMR